MKALFIYSWGPPDDVVSAKHVGDLAESFQQNGYRVDFWCGNRSYRNPKEKYPYREKLHGIFFNRISNFNFKSVIFRKIVNQLIFNCVLVKRILTNNFLKDYDIIITSTDPVLNFALVTNLVKIFNKKTKIVLWSLDLYPEALAASKKISDKSLIYKLLSILAGISYRKIDHFLSIGNCMSERVLKYKINKIDYLYPWALNDDEVVDINDISEYRKRNYPPNKKILLLSGSFGFAHISEEFFKFLDQINDRKDILLVCSIRGNKADKVINYIQSNNINCIIKGFVPLEDLNRHLNSVDIHITVVNKKWSGIVVPSKFFGSLNSAKPTLFIGPGSSEVSRVIEKYHVGWTCTNNNFSEVLKEIESLTRENFDQMSLNAKRYYDKNILKTKQIEKFLEKL
jgi:hypothetical protein